MADREDQPAPQGVTAAGLSADEAERLSEKFHPSWEAEGEKPQTIPLVEGRKPVKQTLTGGVSPFAAAAPRPPPAAPASASAGAPSAKAEGTARVPARPRAQQTLVGIAPTSNPPPLPAPKPKAELPSGPVTAGGSPDGPSGIAKVYKPKDDPAAPPVVLTEELQRAEAAANAEIEARRRSQSSQRHMQTVMNVKAPDFPDPGRPKRRSGIWQLLMGVTAGVVVVAAVFKLTAKDEAPAPVEPAAATPPAASEEPKVTPVAPAEEEGPSRPVVLPAETATGDIVEPGAESRNPAPRRTSSKTPAVAPAQKKAAPKPTKPVAKETAPSPPASKGGVIVRDNPF